MLALEAALRELQGEKSTTSEHQNQYGDKNQTCSVQFFNFPALGGLFPLNNAFPALFTRLSGSGPRLYGFPKLGGVLIIYLADRKFVHI